MKWWPPPTSSPDSGPRPPTHRQIPSTIVKTTHLAAILRWTAIGFPAFTGIVKPCQPPYLEPFRALPCWWDVKVVTMLFRFLAALRARTGTALVTLLGPLSLCLPLWAHPAPVCPAPQGRSVLVDVGANDTDAVDVGINLAPEAVLGTTANRQHLVSD